MLEKIKSKGYWRVLVRPQAFDPELVPYGELTNLLRKSAVDLRGWDFPHVLDENPNKEKNYVYLDTDFDGIVESWRFYQSGQFIHYAGIISDWRDTKNASLNQYGKVLGVIDTVGRYTDIFEFSSRLARSIPKIGDLEIEIILRGLRDRFLVNEASPIGLRGQHVADLDEFSSPQAKAYSEAELTARPRELALQAALELFRRFGWNSTEVNLRAIQERILRR